MPGARPAVAGPSARLAEASGDCGGSRRRGGLLREEAGTPSGTREPPSRRYQGARPAERAGAATSFPRSQAPPTPPPAPRPVRAPRGGRAGPRAAAGAGSSEVRVRLEVKNSPGEDGARSPRLAERVQCAEPFHVHHRVRWAGVALPREERQAPVQRRWPPHRRLGNWFMSTWFRDPLLTREEVKASG
ncbi:bridging integrator 2-like [Equus przewalskii]|uniref:Bridging integrator 2-like n=1 Tax=Equus przewalskii TaxID=9798 RepID=A0ABM4QGI0_EQUPR